jgi:transposase
LLVVCATSVIKAATMPASKQMTGWLRGLLQRKPRKVAAVALANKIARVAWAVMTYGTVYRRSPTNVEVSYAA